MEKSNKKSKKVCRGTQVMKFQEDFALRGLKSKIDEILVESLKFEEFMKFLGVES